MGEPQLVDQKNSAPLNEMGEDAYYFYVVDLKNEIFINDTKTKQEVVDVRTQFLGSKCWPLEKS